MNHFFLQEALAFREVERVKPELLVCRFRQGQASVIALHHAPHILRDGLKELTKIQVGHDPVVQIEQELKPVPVVRELALEGLSLLKVQGVVHSHCNLRSHQKRKRDAIGSVGTGLFCSEIQRAQPAMSGCKGETTERSHFLLSQQFRHPGESGFPFDVIDNERLLGTPD